MAFNDQHFPAPGGTMMSVHAFLKAGVIAGFLIGLVACGGGELATHAEVN